MWGVRLAADSTAGVAGAKGNFAAFVLDADIPALSHRGASEALGGQLGFSRDSSTSGLRGGGDPLKVNDMENYILSVVGPRPRFSASMVEWACTWKRPNLDSGGIRFSFTEDGMCSFTPPHPPPPPSSPPFSACKAATLGGARAGALSDPKTTIMELHVN